MIDPTNTWLSDHILLSDTLGCHSVYKNGLANSVKDITDEQLSEGEYLCQTLIEPLMHEFGPASFAYGYISPELSRQIVKYQDPDKPSYHRWDAGAALDVCFHDWVQQVEGSSAPIHLAHEIHAGGYEYSRMITYAESPYICLATRRAEHGLLPRRAFYENRYMGVPKGKPMYITKTAKTAKEAPVLEHEWQGAGYPTYHSGGIRQYCHIRTSRYTVLSDFLYHKHAVEDGLGNPIIPADMSLTHFKAAGRVYDYLLDSLNLPKISIIRAYEAPHLHQNSDFAWKNGFSFVIKRPKNKDFSEVTRCLRNFCMPLTVVASKKLDAIWIRPA